MDELKLKILSILQEDARISHENIATMVGAELTTVNTLIKNMEADGTIVKYFTLINSDKCDSDSVEALIEVSVTPKLAEGYDAIAKEIYKFNQVKSVYLMSGSYDLLVTVEGKNLKEVAMFVAEKLSTMETVQSTATRFILKKYKLEGVKLCKEDGSDRLPVQA